MNCRSVRSALLVVVLASSALAVGCGGGAEGKYRDPSGTINAEFKDGTIDGPRDTMIPRLEKVK